MSKKPDGQAYVTINGKRIYLGKYGSPEAMRAYNVLISEMANVHVVSPSRQKKVLLVSELFVGYQRYLTEEKPESGDLSVFFPLQKSAFFPESGIFSSDLYAKMQKLLRTLFFNGL